MAWNSPMEKKPFSPVSAPMISSGTSRAFESLVRAGRRAAPAARRAPPRAASTRYAFSLSPRTPMCFFSTRRKPIIAPGFTSFTIALCLSSDAAGVRARRNSRPVCAKPIADFASSVQRRLVLAVRVRDVQSHPARAGRADLHVDLHARFFERRGAATRMCRAICGMPCEMSSFRTVTNSGSSSSRGIVAVAVVESASSSSLVSMAMLELVLVADRRRGVDAVDHDLRLVLVDQLEERRRLVVRLAAEDGVEELVVVAPRFRRSRRATTRCSASGTKMLPHSPTSSMPSPISLAQELDRLARPPSSRSDGDDDRLRTAARAPLRARPAAPTMPAPPRMRTVRRRARGAPVKRAPLRPSGRSQRSVMRSCVSQRSQSSAAMQPLPAAVMAWR